MRALAIGFYETNTKKVPSSFKELIRLCEACQIEVTETHLYTFKEIHPAYYLGKGRLEMLKDHEVDVFVFNEELTPLQMKNLEDVLGKEVIDRTGLILKIFESRARSKEAILQVRMAKMRYLLPRLSEFSVDLIGQQKGSGFRGSGEKQSELTKRQIHLALLKAKRELDVLKKQRLTQRKRRHGVKKIALVGYTNSGKSSLLNYFMQHQQKHVLEKDMLFASLETQSRQVLIGGHHCIMSDTVGFIQGLPHHLIEAFKSTLEEVKEADLLLHVIDSASDDVMMQIETVEQVLKDLGIKDIPILYVYNKTDLRRYALIKAKQPSIFISVKHQIHLDLLENKIVELCFNEEHHCFFKVPYINGAIYQELRHHCTLLEESYEDEDVIMEVRCSSAIFEKYQAFRLMH